MPEMFRESDHPRARGGKFRAKLAARARALRRAGRAKIAAHEAKERAKIRDFDARTAEKVAAYRSANPRANPAVVDDKARAFERARGHKKRILAATLEARLKGARQRVRAAVRYEHDAGKHASDLPAMERDYERYRRRRQGMKAVGDIKAAIARAKAAKKPPTAPKSPSAGKFEEAKHPRGQGGKFRDTGSESRRKPGAGRSARRDPKIADAIARAKAARQKRLEDRATQESDRWWNARHGMTEEEFQAGMRRAYAANLRADEQHRSARAAELRAKRQGRSAKPGPESGEAGMQAARDRYEAGIAGARKESALAKVRTGATNADRHRAVRVRGVQPKATKPERPAERGAGFIGEIPADDIHFDPARFQYKLATTDHATGSVGSLAGVKKWDKELAGVVGVWKDPANNKTFVVNGHNRLDLARKLGVDKVAVRYLDAPTAEMARAKGALANIAEGRGTSVDAAKFFRDSGIKDVQSLQDRGIPLAEGKTREGLALAGLANPLFRRVIDGTLPIDKAAIIGGGGLSDSQQMQLGKLLDKQKGRATSAQVREWVDEAKAAGERKRDSGPGLFGDDGSDDEALFLHRTALNAHVAERLSREKKLFGTVARKRSADELSKGGNVIDAEASGRISRDASEALAVFSELKRTSVFAGATREATVRMAEAKNDRERAKVRDEYYAEVKKRVRDAYNLGK